MNSTLKFSISQEGIDCLLGETEKKRISNYINIKKININRDTNIETYELEYRRRNTNTLTVISIDSEQIQKDKILKLSKYGVDISDDNKTLVSQFLYSTLQTAPITITTDGYGWKRDNSQEIFIADKILSASPMKDEVIKNTDKLDLKPNGEIKNWLNMYNEYVKGHKYLELAVVFGLSAPILNYLCPSYPDLSTVLLHISGDSTSGKSTASMLAVSTAGNPNQISSNSLVRKWSGTENSIIATLEDVSGIPIVFDELSAFRGDNLTQLAYTITDGVGKARAKVDGELNKPKNWNTVILSNGETTISSKSNNNTGIKARVFEHPNISWTKSAEQAEAIKEICCNNFGHLLPLFIKNLFEYGTNKITEIFEKERKILKDKLPNSRLKDRIVTKLSVFTTTAKLLKETNTLDVSYSDILHILYEQELSSMTNREIGMIAYDKLLQYLVANKAKLSYNTYKQLGFIKNDTIFILKDQLNDILKELKFEDTSIVIKDWNKRDFLVKTESDRQTTRKQEGNQSLIGYTLKISEEYMPYFNDQSNTNFSNKIVSLQNEAINNLKL